MMAIPKYCAVIALAAAGLLAGGCSQTTVSYCIEHGGVIRGEIEAQPAVDAWRAETDMEGFSGQGYYTWRGDDLLKTPGHGELVYHLIVKTPGAYTLRIRNRHDHEDATLENDAWVKIDDGEWIKAFSSRRGRWTWYTRLDLGGHKLVEPVYDLTAGRHVLTISGRSKGFSIDSFLLFHEEIDGPSE